MGQALKALAVYLALAGCVTSAPVDNPRQVWCDHNKPRRPSLAVIAAMTRPELDEMNAYNAGFGRRASFGFAVGTSSVPPPPTNARALINA